MFRKPPIFVLLTGLVFCNLAFALEWKDVVNQALEKNPTFQSQKQNSEIAKLKQSNARSLMYPRVNLNGNFRMFQDQTLNLRHQISVGPTLQYLIYQGGKVRAGIDQADALTHQTDMSVRLNNIAIHSKLRQAFASALRAKNYLDLSLRVEKQRLENLKFAKIRYESGMEYKWVYMSSEIKWQQAKLDVQEALMNKKTALADLENLLGDLQVNSVEELSGDDFYSDDVEYNLEELISKIDKNPKYLFNQSAVDGALAEVEENKAARFPSIGFEGGVGVVNTERQDFSPLTDAFVPYWLVGVGLNIPLYEGKRIRRNIEVSKAGLIQKKFELEQARLDIKASITRNYQTYFISKQKLEISKTNVEITKDRSKVVSRQYKSGLTTFLDWESSQDGWVSAEIELLNDKQAYQIARAKLEEAIGLGLGE